MVYCSWRVDTPQDIPTPIRVVLWTHQRTYPCQLRGGQGHTHHQDMERETNAQLVRERSKYTWPVRDIIRFCILPEPTSPPGTRPRDIGRMRYDSKILHPSRANLSPWDEAKGQSFTTLAELGVTLKRFLSPLQPSGADLRRDNAVCWSQPSHFQQPSRSLPLSLNTHSPSWTQYHSQWQHHHLTLSAYGMPYCVFHRNHFPRNNLEC